VEWGCAWLCRTLMTEMQREWIGQRLRFWGEGDLRSMTGILATENRTGMRYDGTMIVAKCTTPP
jgi:hypothetical protein